MPSLKILGRNTANKVNNNLFQKAILKKKGKKLGVKWSTIDSRPQTSNKMNKDQGQRILVFKR